jgi:hypothetical protein
MVPDSTIWSLEKNYNTNAPQRHSRNWPRLGVEIHCVRGYSKEAGHAVGDAGLYGNREHVENADQGSNRDVLSKIRGRPNVSVETGTSDK